MASPDASAAPVENWKFTAGRRACEVGLDGVSYKDHFLSFGSEKASRLRMKQLFRLTASQEPSASPLSPARASPSVADETTSDGVAPVSPGRTSSRAGRSHADAARCRSCGRTMRRSSRSVSTRSVAEDAAAAASDAMSTSASSRAHGRHSRCASRHSVSPVPKRQPNDSSMESAEGEVSRSNGGPWQGSHGDQPAERLPSMHLGHVTGPQRARPASAPAEARKMVAATSPAVMAHAALSSIGGWQQPRRTESLPRLGGSGTSTAHADLVHKGRTMATLAGQACTPAQRRLADPSSFTGFYRWRFDRSPPPQTRDPASGDYCARPLKASRMLINRSASQLNIPGRACDFRAETGWRLTLRPSRPNSTA